MSRDDCGCTRSSRTRRRTGRSGRRSRPGFEARARCRTCSVELQPWDGQAAEAQHRADGRQRAGRRAAATGHDSPVRRTERPAARQRRAVGRRTHVPAVGGGRVDRAGAGVRACRCTRPSRRPCTTASCSRRRASPSCRGRGTRSGPPRPSSPRAAIPVLDYSGSAEEPLNLTFYPLLWQAGGSVFNADGKKSAFVVTGRRCGAEVPGRPQGDERTAARRRDQAERPQGLPGRDRAGGDGPRGDRRGARNVIAAIGGENTAIGLPLQQKTRSTFGTPGGVVVAAHKDPARRNSCSPT